MSRDPHHIPGITGRRATAGAGVRVRLSLALLLAAGCASPGAGDRADAADPVDAVNPADAPSRDLAIDLFVDPGTRDSGPPDAPEPPDAAGGDVPVPDAAARPLALHALEPASGPAGAMSTVTLTGSGFVDGMEVRFGSRRAPYVFVLADGLADCTVPAAPAGVVDVSVHDPDGRVARLERAFTYRAELALAGVAPAEGPPGGGTPIVIRGAGFLGGPMFLLGGREVVAVQVVDDGTALGITPPHAPGPVTLHALGDGAQVALTDAFLYLEEVVRPSLPGMSLLAIRPGAGPAAGGTAVRILGSGFGPGASVRFGGIPATDVTFVSEGELRAVTPRGSPGPVDVAVRVSVGETVLRDGYEYLPPAMAILALEPESGAFSGGTRVRVMGQGLGGVRRVFFGGVEATEVVVESSVAVVARAPRAEAPGPVMLMALGDGGAFRERAFLYFDPAQRGGGTWGGPIRGDVNVTVLNGQTGRGLPGAYVMLGADPHTPHQGATDDRGQITFSDLVMRGPVDVHATAVGQTAASLAGFDARNATLYVSPVPSPESTPGTPGGTTGSTCTVEGRILDYGKYLLKPPWAMGTPFGQCWTSASTMFGSNPDPGPGQYADAQGRFRIATRRGRFAVVCAMMVAPATGGLPFPVRMGLVPRVDCRDRPVGGVEVALTHDTDADLWFAVRGLPEHELGINGPSVLGGWNLGDDGFLDLLRRVERPLPDRLRVPWQPVAMDGPFAGAGHSVYQTASARTTNSLPYAVTLSAGLQPPATWPVLAWDGADPVPLATGIPRAVTAIGPVPGGLLAADEGGATYLFDGAEFQAGPVRTGYAIRGLWGTAPDAFWAVGDQGRAWRVVGRDVIQQPVGVVTDLTGVSGIADAADDRVSIAAGPYLLRYQDGSFSHEALPAGARVSAVRRFADGRLAAVGPAGAVVTGVSGGELSVIRPTDQDLVALDGASADDFWAVGRQGALIRRDGEDVTVWALPGPREYAGLIVRGPCDVLAFGREGTVVAFDCAGFTDLSRPDVALDLLAGGLLDGRPLMAGRHYVALPAFLGFPRIANPAEGLAWDRRDVAWALPAGADPTHHQLLLSGPTGYAFWVVTAGGAVRRVPLPDFARAIGYDPVPDGTKRINVTSSRSPGFDIDGFTSTDTGYYRQEAFSVGVGTYR